MRTAKPTAPPHGGGGKSSLRFPAEKPAGGQQGSYRKVTKGYGVSGDTGRNSPMPRGKTLHGPGWK